MNLFTIKQQENQEDYKIMFLYICQRELKYNLERPNQSIWKSYWDCQNLVGACTLLPSLSNSNIKLLNSVHVAMDGVIASQNQTIDLPYIFALEIQNQNMNMTVQPRKKKELGFFTLLNERTKNKT